MVADLDTNNGAVGEWLVEEATRHVSKDLKHKKRARGNKVWSDALNRTLYGETADLDDHKAHGILAK